MSGSSLRLGTWNIGACKNIDAVMSVIADQNIDICVLQEVSLAPDADLPGIFNRSTPVFREYNLQYTPALSPEEFGGGRPEYFGLGIVSKHPLRHVLSFQLGPLGSGSVGDAEKEPRLLQIAMPSIGPPLIFANTHLAATGDMSLSAIRRSQVTRIANIVRPLVGEMPVVLGGDFNATSSSDDLADLRSVLPHVYAGSGATYQGDNDRLVIDFFQSSVPLDIAVTVVPANGLSDHNMVVAALQSWPKRTG